MSVRTLPAFLVGNRDAILDLAATRWTLLIGGLFVLSAGLAREYDGADLLREPWHLLIPFASSLVACAGLFVIAVGVQLGRAKFLSFLGLFWMTAPLAWIYAIPFERFLDERAALTANFVCLGVVSVWRVALMTRVVVVLTGCTPLAAVGRVLCFGALVLLLLAVFSFAPLFLFAMMGSRFPPAEETRQGVSTLAFVLSFPLLIGALILQAQTRLPPTQRWPWRRLVIPVSLPWGVGRLVAAAVVGVLVWLIPNVWTQPEQQRAWRVDSMWRQGNRASAMAYLSLQQPSDLPPHWRPPPRWTIDVKWVQQEALLQELDEVLRAPSAPWVRARHLEQLDDLFDTMVSEYGYSSVRLEVLEKLAALLEFLPEGPTLARKYAERIKLAVEMEREREPERTTNPGQEVRQSHPLERLMKLGDQR